MPLYRAFLQTLGATLLLAVAIGCRSSSSSSNGGGIAPNNEVNITGTLTYTRVPLATDTNGVPTGLVDTSVATNLKVLPVRGTVVRAYQQVDQTQPDGSIVKVWTMASATMTDSAGKYTLKVAKDVPTTVEVLSIYDGGRLSLVYLIGEPDGINSPVDAPNRLCYALRKAADGTTTSGISPTNPNTPKSSLTANAVVNFSVGLNDAWWLVNPTFTVVGSASDPLAPFVETAVLETTLAGRTAGLGSGSRILGIGDSIASFVATYGLATSGSTLDLHYWPGRSEPNGSFIEYNRSVFYPRSFDGYTRQNHYFGSLRGEATNDDAWDEGVILPMLARNMLFYQNNVLTQSSRTFSVPTNLLYPIGTALTDLSPDMARIEGLADAMSANVLKSPFLADTAGTALAVPARDIRDISLLTPAEKSPLSAPSLRGFGWEIVLKANSVASPGTPTTWATINSYAAARFFMAPTGLVSPNSNSATHDSEPLNIYSQIGRLRELKSSSEPVDLNTIFTDSVLTDLAAPFRIPWPRPLTGIHAAYASDWGVDPISPFPPVVLSMAKAVQVNMPSISTPGVVSYQLAYPNVAKDEVFYTGFSLSADKRCHISAAISPALQPGSSIEVDLPELSRTLTFNGSGGSTEPIVLPGLSGFPIYQPVRLRLKNATAIQPDVTVTLSLTPAP